MLRGMTRCASERETGLGLAWRMPETASIRIETPRVVIRSLELGDAPAMFEAVEASRSTLLPWMAWARDQHRDLAETTHFVTKQILALRSPAEFTMVTLGIFEREGGRFLGATGVHDVRRDTASAETGYWVRTEARGRGIATEATRHLLSWALRPQGEGGLGLARVRIYCSALNTASRRVIEKLGVRLEVEQRADYFVPDVGVTDRLGWGVLATEWDTRSHRPLRDEHA